MRPLLFRPPFWGSGSSSDFSGVVAVTSAKSATVWKRRPGEVGLYFFSPIVSPSLRLPDHLGPRNSMRSGWPDAGRPYHGAGWLHQPPCSRKSGSVRGYLPANKSIVSPSLRVTIAFFHERDSPLLYRTRRG